MCVNEAGSIRLMEEKDVEQVEELEKQCFSVPWSENILKDGLTGRFDTYLVWEKDGIVAGYCALSCLLYTSPSPRDGATSRMPSSAAR